MSDSLEIQDLHFSYLSEQPVLQGVSASFAGGEISALLGNNGSGKTTLLKILVGIQQTRQGCIRFAEQTIGPTERIEYRKILGYMPESLQLYPQMRACDALKFFARLKQLPLAAVDEVLVQVGLGSHSRKKIRTYSKGMKQRLNFAQAILGSPRILVLDEPSNGFDYSGVYGFYQILRELRDQGIVIILSSHQLSEIQDQVDHIAVLSEGMISHHGPLDTLLNQATLRKRKTWIQFDTEISGEDWNEFLASHSSLQQVDPQSVTGTMDAPELEAFLFLARSRGKSLANLRIEGTELADLLEVDA